MVSWATWLLFTGVPATCAVLLCGVLGHLAPVHLVYSLRVLCCMRGVLGLLVAVLQCARSACCVAYTLSSASWLPFTGVSAECLELCVVCAVS